MQNRFGFSGKGFYFCAFFLLLGKGLCWEVCVGGNNAKPWQSVSRVGFAGGADGGDLTPQPSPLLYGNVAPWM